MVRKIFLVCKEIKQLIVILKSSTMEDKDVKLNMTGKYVNIVNVCLNPNKIYESE